MTGRGSVFLLYHFYRPDDVVSARLFTDLAEDLTESGFDVTAVPSTRSCHGSKVRLAKREVWAGGKIRRIWRPDWPQHKTAGRFGNTLFMLLGWTWIAANSISALCVAWSRPRLSGKPPQNARNPLPPRQNGRPPQSRQSAVRNRRHARKPPRAESHANSDCRQYVLAAWLFTPISALADGLDS